MRLIGLVLAGWSIGFGTAILTRPWWWEDGFVMCDDCVRLGHVAWAHNDGSADA